MRGVRRHHQHAVHALDKHEQTSLTMYNPTDTSEAPANGTSEATQPLSNSTFSTVDTNTTITDSGSSSTSTAPTTEGTNSTIPITTEVPDNVTALPSTSEWNTSTEMVTDNTEPQARNCTEPYIKKFPRDVFTNVQRRRGAMVLHLLCMIVAFVAIRILVEEYFVPSLERFCEILRLDEDITGATFMAAGSSAPEIFISIVGSFLSNTDVSFGTIVGSAVFNILFVIGICAVLTPTIVKLNWWPFFRDSTCYCFSAVVLFFCLMDGKIQWYESVILLVLYGFYIVVLIFNRPLQALTARLIGRNALETQFLLDPEVNQSQAYHKLDQEGEDAIALSQSVSSMNINETGSEWETVQAKTSKMKQYSLFPLKAIFLVTIPDCRQHKWRKLFPLSFLMSAVWLAVWCTLLVWMVAVIGYTMSIPDSIMGITFLAAGTSLPDALASVYAVKAGYANMGVSNTIGSNIFDLLVALAVPWLVRSCVSHTYVSVNSRGLRFNAVLLISGVIISVLCVKYRQFYLDRSLGLILICCYMLYLVISLMIEMNVFGLVNLPMCPLQ